MKNNSHDFKSISEIVVNKLATYLDESQQGTGKVLTQNPPEEIAKELQLEKLIKAGGLNSTSVDQFLDSYLANTQHLHHPHYIGHQVAVPHVASGISDFIHGIINNPMAIYEMGPAAAVIERFVVNWMLDKLGWFNGAHLSDFKRIKNNGAGVLTHGGSLANLTAMLAARAKIAPDAWIEGTPNDLVILAPEESHYSIARSISIIGMGSDAIIPIPVDDLNRMKPEALLPAYQQALAKGKRIMAVVANACATGTGLHDPLDEIGLFCENYNLWFHVDAAHGASALISKKEKHFLKGIERADSTIWDAHKMMRTSSLCAAVLFKEHDSMENAFKQKGSYLFHDKEEVGFDLMPYTIECTKSALGTKLFWVLASEGEKSIANYIDETYHNTRLFYTIINKHPDFNCPYFPETNILCFQYIKFRIDNSFQLALRNEIVSRGNFYITSTELNGSRYLRLTVMNNLTKKSHIQKLLDEIIEVAAYLKVLD
jgi:L-2,4-diaminobutyrate decarboxylase